MPDYTTFLQEQLDAVSWEDEDFMEELLRVTQLFRPFSAAMGEFLAEHGGDPGDTGGRVAVIREAFLRAGMEPPREIREWFAGQPVRRDTAFQICFAFGLDSAGTDAFFRRVYTRERSFNCHRVQEAVYYFCLKNGLGWGTAMDILGRVPLTGKDSGDGEMVYTASIVAQLDPLETPEELVAWLRGNIGKFIGSDVTACETIRRLWRMTAGPDGLLIRERNCLPSMLDDVAAGEKSRLRAGAEGLKPWDACLAILQLDKRSVKRLETDRSIRPILERLPPDARDSFPDRQGIDRILRGGPVSHERVRKWLVMLTFYTFWARRAVERGSYEAREGDMERCVSGMNQHLVNCGYPELYVGNPYDWVFFWSARCEEPLFVFRYIWNELLAGTLEHR